MAFYLYQFRMTFWALYQLFTDPKIYYLMAFTYVFVKYFCNDIRKCFAWREELEEKEKEEEKEEDGLWKFTPLSPMIMRYFKSWKTIGDSETLKIALGTAGKCHVPPEYLVTIQHFLNEQFGSTTALPLNTIAVSIANEKFHVARDSLHEFVPSLDEKEKEEETEPKETYFSYDQPTENLQFTYYHTSQDDYSLAGVCIYFPETMEEGHLEKEMEEIKEMFEEDDKEEEEEEDKKIEETVVTADKEPIEKEFEFVQ